MLSEVYDIEVLINFFSYTGYCRQENKFYQFIIHQSKNEYNELIAHLKRCELIQIGFNNDNYDYPIIHHLLNHVDEYSTMRAIDLVDKIYSKSQEVISNNFNTVADKNKHIKQIDLFKIWHLDNPGRSASLKSLEVSMNFKNVEDMPFHHYKFINSEDDIQKILSYNTNDVLATNEFLNITLGDTDLPLYKGKNKINLRQSINKVFKVPCLNHSDVKIGEDLVLTYYCKYTGKNKYAVSKTRTERHAIDIAECIPHWCKFKTKLLDDFLNKLKKKRLLLYDPKQSSFSDSVIFHNIKMDCGVGGLHACIKPGVYTSDDKYIIVDKDISSLYPSLAVTLKLFPEHLGEEFLHIYSNLVEIRLKEKSKPKEERNNTIIEGLKLSLNG